jgi:hypothetical protein
LIGFNVNQYLLILLLVYFPAQAQMMPQRSPPSSSQPNGSIWPTNAKPSPQSSSDANHLSLQQGRGVIGLSCDVGYSCETGSFGNKSARLGHSFEDFTVEMHYTQYGTAHVAGQARRMSFTGKGAGVSAVFATYKPYWMYYSSIGVSKNTVIFEQDVGASSSRRINRLHTIVGVGVKVYDKTFLTFNYDSSLGEVLNPDVNGGIGLTLYSLGVVTRF